MPFKRGAGATVLPEDLIDGTAELQGINNAGTSPAERWVNRSLRPTPEIMASAPHSYLTGGVADVQRDAASNVRTVRQTTGAGQRTTCLQVPCLNVGVVAGAVGGPVPTRPLRRYSAEYELRWTVRGTAVLEVGAVLSNGMLSFLGTDPAFVLSSDPAVNGGRFTARVRVLPAGAITTLNDTGISPSATTWVRFGCRYTEGLTPLLELLIAGNVVAQREGLAQLPQNTSGSFQSAVFAFGASAVVGTTIERAYSRFRVEEIV